MHDHTFNPLQYRQGDVQRAPVERAREPMQVQDILDWHEFFTAKPELRTLATTNPNERNSDILQKEFDEWKASKN